MDQTIAEMRAVAAEREEKPVAELERGNWVEVISDDGDTLGEARVLHVETFEDGDFGRRTLLVYSVPGYNPDTIRLDADFTLPLLTEDEIAFQLDAERRTRIAAQLSRLIDVLSDPEIPLPPIHRAITIGVDYGREVEALGAFAKAFNAVVREVGGTLGAEVYGAGDQGEAVDILAKGLTPAEPAPEPIRELLAIAPSADGGVAFALAPAAAVTDPVARAKVVELTEAVADDPTGLVDETEPAVEHAQVGAEVGSSGIGDISASCTCGVTTGGWDTPAQAEEQIALHIESATSPTGLTRAADASRGVLAGTTPVVTYFSFGYGQKDPDTFKNLLNHYVTVVAPTYEACREAMFASRFGNRWSFDYLAGTKQATAAVREWTEHEVIVAPGVDQASADRALADALKVLD